MAVRNWLEYSHLHEGIAILLRRCSRRRPGGCRSLLDWRQFYHRSWLSRLRFKRDSRFPAYRAGLRGGERIIAVNGSPAGDLAQAADLLRSNTPDSMKITLLRADKEINVVLQRERRSVIIARTGKKLAKDGMVVTEDTAQAELDRNSAIDFSRQTGRVFQRTHYPANAGLFYPGFELFVFRDPNQVMVGEIEEGPGARARVHYGDVVISVNGVSVAGKTSTELETLFSSPKPAAMRLQIDRLGTLNGFEFPLAKAAEIANRNGRRILSSGQLVPLGASDRDLPCFFLQ